MKYRTKYPVIEYMDSLYYTDDQNNPTKIIEHPAVLIDPSSDMIHKYGEAANLLSILVKWQESISKVNEILNESYPDEPENIAVLVELDRLSTTEQAYVINRMLLFTATNFVSNFYKAVMEKDDRWLTNEMERLNIYE